MRKYLALSTCLALGACMDTQEIQMVKRGSLTAFPQKTVEQTVNGFFGSPRWESGQASDGKRYVTIRGKMTYMEKPVNAALQFVVNKQEQTFEYQAFEMNDIPQNGLLAVGLLSKMCGEN